MSIDKLIHSLVIGYTKYNNLIIKRPTSDIEYEADLFYEEVYNESLEYALTFDKLLNRLYELELWDIEREYRFSEIPKEIENNKIELYENRNKSGTVKIIKNRLQELRTEFADLFNVRHAYDSYSCEGIANFLKLCYIVKRVTFKNKKLYRFNKESLEEIVQEFQKSTLSEDKLREIGRNDCWSGYWTAIKNNIRVFHGNLTDEQRRIIRISVFYDNLRQSPECPPEWVIEDNDMLDGFLISNKKKESEEEDKRDFTSTISPNIANCSEVYVVCENQEDANKVYSMNNNYAKTVQAARDRVISEKGKVCEVDLPDVKKQLMMEMARAGV